MLRSFAAGEAKALAVQGAEWAELEVELASVVEAELHAHLRACSKCRAFSVFSRSAGLRRQPPLTELTLATLCKDSMQTLNRILAAAMLREKDRILATMAESMLVGIEGLASHEGVTAHRLDASFASLAACAAERDRILAQVPMREDFRPMLARLSEVQAALGTWRAVATPHFRGGRIPHRHLSLVTCSDVEDTAMQQLWGLTAAAAARLAAWESKWKPAVFGEVFSLFGTPLFDFACVPPHRAAPWHSAARLGDMGDALLTAEEVAATRPMRAVVRVRPALSHEEGDALTARALEDGTTVSFKVPHSSSESSFHALQFDAALECSQAELFSSCGIKALVHKACEGHTATVFAYGQTGAGKTHSLLGPKECMTQLIDDAVLDEEGRLPGSCYSLVDAARRAKVLGQGLLPRAVQFLFKVLRASNSGAPCTIRVSFMELYNERVYDLLCPGSGQLDVHQRPPPERGFHVPGLVCAECQGPESLLQALRQGLASRHTGGHSCSRDSSRAHAIFTMELPAASSSKPGGKLIFADLAGSERIKRIQGAAQQETAHINKSLLMLSNCVSAISSSSAGGVGSSGAFRNSKLTKVLMESLCGAGYTLLIAAASPAQRHFDETANTLFFAAKCASITRRVEPRLTPQQREVQELRDTVEALRTELTEARRRAKGDGGGGNEGDVAAGSGTVTLEVSMLRRELEAERQKNAALQLELDALRGEVQAVLKTTMPSCSDVGIEERQGSRLVAAGQLRQSRAPENCGLVASPPRQPPCRARSAGRP